MRKLYTILLILTACNKIESVDKPAAAYNTILAETIIDDSWPTFAHDAANTSASTGALNNLVFAWEYSPILPTGTSTKNAGAGNIIADKYFIWHKIDLYDPSINSGISTASFVYKLSNDGIKRWITERKGINASHHTGMAMLAGTIQFADDAIEIFSATDKSSLGRVTLDFFGNTTAYNGSFIYTQCLHVDGNTSPLYIAFNNTEIYYPVTGSDVNLGHAIADNGKVFYHPYFRYGFTDQPTLSGIYGYDYNTKAQLFFIQGISEGRLSAANNKLFSTEGNNFVCRSQSNGSVLWSNSITGNIINQPAVLVNPPFRSLAIIATTSGVTAYDQVTGELVWNNPILNIGFQYYPSDDENTVMSAANNLVVTSEAGVHLLNFDGNQIQFVPSYLSGNLRFCNPVIVEGLLYLNTTEKYFNPIGNTLKVVCYRDAGYTPPPPPIDTVIVPPPPPPPPPVQSVTLMASGNTLSWAVTNITVTSQQLQQYTKRGKAKWVTIYTGNPPKTVSAGQYRVVINNSFYSNILKL